MQGNGDGGALGGGKDRRKNWCFSGAATFLFTSLFVTNGVCFYVTCYSLVCFQCLNSKDMAGKDFSK